MDELYNIQKNRFSELHSQHSKFLNLLKSKEKLDSDTLYKILELNNNIDILITNLINIEYDFIKDDSNHKDKIKDFQDNEKIFKDFMPYIFAYKLLLQNKQ